METAPKYYSAEQIKSVLTWPLINEAVEESLKAVSNKEKNEGGTSFVNQPARTITTANDKGKLLLTMPAHVGNYKLSTQESALHNTLACKLVTSFAGNSELQPPLPNILANILLFNTKTGQLECIMDGTEITAWRTAAASIIATKYLYFKRFCEDLDPHGINLAIIGCGVQGQSHALGMCSTFPISKVYLWNRTKVKATALAEQLQSITDFKGEVVVCETADKAVSDADVICVGTYSPTSLINLSMLEKQQIHINTVGAGQIHYGEVAQDIYDIGEVYVDSWANAKTELSTLKAKIISEVGEVINTANYPLENGITIFQSMGMAAEDTTVAQTIFNILKTKNV